MKAKRKQNSNRGFTLAETLMAVLILLLVSLIVANGMPAARDAYQKVVLTANAQTLLSTAVNALRDEVGTAWDVRPVPGDTTALTYMSSDTGARSKIYVTEDDTYGNIIMLEENAELKDLGIIEQEKNTRPLVQDGTSAGTSNLAVSYGSLEIKEDANGKSVIFKGLKVTCKEGDTLRPLIEMKEDENVTIRVF